MIVILKRNAKIVIAKRWEQLPAEEPPLDTLVRLKIEHQNFLSSFLQEEITTPVEVLRETGTKNNTMLKQVYGLLFFDQAGERKFFRLTGKDFENLYAHSYNASIVCLKPYDTAYDSEVFLSSEGITGQRESMAWQQYITAQWVAQNKLSEITNEISIIANCENKTDMFNKKSEN